LNYNLFLNRICRSSNRCPRGSKPLSLFVVVVLKRGSFYHKVILVMPKASEEIHFHMEVLTCAILLPECRVT